MRKLACGFFLVGLMATLPCPTVCAQESASLVDRDFEFASWLISQGLPDYADRMIQKILRDDPKLEDRAKVITAEIAISRNQLADAEAILKSMPKDSPKAQAINLALAKRYFAQREIDKAKAVYAAFFASYGDKPPADPDLLKFYQDAAYQFANMLELSGDFNGAAAAYRRVINALKAPGTEDLQRTVKVDLANALIKQAEQTKDGAARERMLAEAEKNCADAQWKQDITFGLSVIAMTNAKLVRGDEKSAQKLLNDYMDILRSIDKALEEGKSRYPNNPMAGARFLLGSLYEREAARADKNAALPLLAKALTEHYNVFIKYGDSDWGTEAGLRAQTLKDKIEKDYDKKVDIDLGAHKDQAARQQFKMADTLFLQKKDQEAVEEYLKTLNLHPTGEAAVQALGNLAMSFARLDDELSTQAAAGYLGETFRGVPGAARGLLALGLYYVRVASNTPMYTFVYNTYLENFPKDENAAGVLYTLAGLRGRVGDNEGARAYYRKIVDNYPQDQYYTKALSRIAWDAYKGSNYTAAVEGFKLYLAEAQPSPEKALGQISYAESLRQLEKYEEAIQEYAILIRWLKEPNNPYGIRKEDIDRNADLVEKAMFQLGVVNAKIKSDSEEAKSLSRKRAIAFFDQFLQSYPKSTLAPKALAIKGAVQMEMNDPSAAATFDRLSREYPASEEGKMALYSQINAALSIGQTNQARQAFAKMATMPANYSAEEFVVVGQALLDAGVRSEAATAFQQALSKESPNPDLTQQALFGKSAAEFGQKNYKDAATTLNDLLKRFPRSGLFFDAKLMLATSLMETEDFVGAAAALGDVLKMTSQGRDHLIHEANYRMGLIQERSGEKEKALASYSIVALLALPKDEPTRVVLEKCLASTLRLGLDLKKASIVLQAAERYEDIFPQGPSIVLARKAKADAKIMLASGATS